MRRAVAIQLIINRELGLNQNQNPWQGSFLIDELTDLVEEAVTRSSTAISERGGVLGAMETMYQRGKIQEESLYYEHPKHDGSLPLIGVNTFLAERDAGGAERRDAADPLDREREAGPDRAVRDVPAAQRRRSAGGAARLQQVAAARGQRVRRAARGGQGRLARADLARAL